MKVFLATNNIDKGKEIVEGLRDLPIEFLFPHDLSCHLDVKEDGSSFQENAYKKAVAGLKISGIFTIGEDSGLLVDHLKGEPGIKSHRFAGEKAGYEENIKELLRRLKGLPLKKRGAHFKCVICLALSFQKVIFFEGECPGLIALSPRGKFGFGYDPVFIPSGYKKTFGELGPEVKNKISHRAKALRKLKEYLVSLISQERHKVDFFIP